MHDTTSHRLPREGFGTVLAALILLFAAVLLSAPPLAAGPAAPTAEKAASPSAEMRVAVNKSEVLRVDRPLGDIFIGNPEIADVMPLTDRSVYVLGKAVGSTNLTIYDRSKKLIAVVDLAVSFDVDGLKARLFELLPGENVEVRAVNNALVLSGAVSSSARAARASQVAERFAPGAVTNLLSVRGSQQVMLAVRIAEVSRTVARELGIKPSFQYGGSSGRVTVATLDPLDLSRFAAGILDVVSGKFSLNLLIDALEEKGAVRVLAEPTLIALSGDTANFLAGGEFPIPVAQSSGMGGAPVITIEFKEFGVSLAFTPTVLEDGLINLVVNPEVSQIDPNNSINLNGLVIPGLITRRTTTTVELRDGQSFAIAGLLQSDFTDQVRQIPGLGDVPVLGALFRSAGFQRKETELVIIVTPHLVKPAPAGTLASPTDSFVPPSDADLFLFGRPEGKSTGPVTQRTSAEVLSAQPGGGIAGTFGHILK